MLTLAHNASGYDNHYVLDGLTDEFQTEILSKTGEKFLSVEIRNTD